MLWLQFFQYMIHYIHNTFLFIIMIIMNTFITNRYTYILAIVCTKELFGNILILYSIRNSFRLNIFFLLFILFKCNAAYLMLIYITQSSFRSKISARNLLIWVQYGISLNTFIIHKKGQVFIEHTTISQISYL